MAGDIYISAGSMSADLAEAGYERWALQIDEVIVAATSTPDVVRGLHCTLDRLLGEETELPAPLRAKASLLRESLAGSV
ncbi:hypothetical protein ACFQX7_03455 [Luedemannella flava]|uniref:hypothetical protein n=1 Tax=Luedemannella flava TaxID=349316 RepID=UPI0031CE0706